MDPLKAVSLHLRLLSPVSMRADSTSSTECRTSFLYTESGNHIFQILFLVFHIIPIMCNTTKAESIWIISASWSLLLPPFNSASPLLLLIVLLQYTADYLIRHFTPLSHFSPYLSLFSAIVASQSILHTLISFCDAL